MKHVNSSLVRALAEALCALRRSALAKIGSDFGRSLVRARTPHTPQGRALERRPLGRSCARASAKRSSERANGSFLAIRVPKARGNSRKDRQTLFSCPVFWMEERRWPLVAHGATVGRPGGEVVVLANRAFRARTWRR